MTEIGPGDLILLMVLQNALLYLLMGALRMGRGVRYLHYLGYSSAVLAALYTVGVLGGLVFSGLEWSFGEAIAWALKMLVLLLGFLVANAVLATALYGAFFGARILAGRWLGSRAAARTDAAWGEPSADGWTYLSKPAPSEEKTDKEKKKRSDAGEGTAWGQ
jgi:hypothetical protein